MELDEILTIGVTSHNHNVSEELLLFLRGLKHIQVIISENACSKKYEGIKTIFTENNTMEGNRKNIIDNANTKYIFLSDGDDKIKVDEDKVLKFLQKKDADVYYINLEAKGEVPIENIAEKYNHAYQSCWSQVFKTSFIKPFIFPTWNGYSEEHPVEAKIALNTYSNFNYTHLPYFTYVYQSGHNNEISSFDFEGMKKWLLEYRRIEYKNPNEPLFTIVLKFLCMNFFEYLPRQFNKRADCSQVIEGFLNVLREVSTCE